MEDKEVLTGETVSASEPLLKKYHIKITTADELDCFKESDKEPKEYIRSTFLHPKTRLIEIREYKLVDKGQVAEDTEGVHFVYLYREEI